VYNIFYLINNVVWYSCERTLFVGLTSTIDMPTLAISHFHESPNKNSTSDEKKKNIFLPTNYFPSSSSLIVAIIMQTWSTQQGINHSYVVSGDVERLRAKLVYATKHYGRVVFYVWVEQWMSYNHADRMLRRHMPSPSSGLVLQIGHRPDRPTSPIQSYQLFSYSNLHPGWGVYASWTVKFCSWYEHASS